MMGVQNSHALLTICLLSAPGSAALPAGNLAGPPSSPSPGRPVAAISDGLVAGSAGVAPALGSVLSGITHSLGGPRVPWEDRLCPQRTACSPTGKLLLPDGVQLRMGPRGAATATDPASSQAIPTAGRRAR